MTFSDREHEILQRLANVTQDAADLETAITRATRTIRELAPSDAGGVQ